MRFQYDWQGPRLQNLRILVCPNGCYDKPQENLRTIVLPPDPVPVQNPRPETYFGTVTTSAGALPAGTFPAGDNPISGVNWSPSRLFIGVPSS